MKNKKVWLITVLSLLACSIHTLILNTNFTFYALTSVLKIILFVLFPLIYYKFISSDKIKDMFVKGDRKYIKRCFALGCAVFAFIMVAFLMLKPFISREMVVDSLEKNSITSSNYFLVFIYIVLINAALEEFFFRGFVFMTFYRLNIKRYAHTYSSLLFAFYHVAILQGALSTPVFIFCIFGLVIAGLIFNFLVIKCKSMSGSLIVHICANLAINIIILIFLLKPIK